MPREVEEIQFCESLKLYPTNLDLKILLQPGNVCRESPEGERVLTNPDKSFKQSNGETVRCCELQEWVQDVKPSGGAPGEARMCEIVQYLAWLHCDCAGPEIPSPDDTVEDLNPSCNLCGDPGLDFNFVPQPNRNKLSDTGCCGQQSCEILYYGASQGTLSANLCGIVQQNSGPDCCNLEIIGPPSNDSDDDEDGDQSENDGEGENEGEGEEDEEDGDEDEDNQEYEIDDPDQEEENQDDESDCEDDPDFLFKGRIGKDCEWVASRGLKKKKKVCRRKSFGTRVWRLCPRSCKKCHRLDKVEI